MIRTVRPPRAAPSGSHALGLRILWLLALAAGAAAPSSARAQEQVRPQSHRHHMSADLLGRGPAGRPHPFADASGRLPLMVAIPPGTDAEALGMRLLAPGFATLRAAPEEVTSLIAEHPDLSFTAWGPRRVKLDRSGVLNRTNEYRASLAAAAAASPGSSSNTRGTGKGVVIGVLDTGIDTSHQDFRDETGATRIAWLLDMSKEPLGLHPDLEAKFGCGALKQTHCAVLDASDINRALGGAFDPPTDKVGHGTHVASIAAGNGGIERRYVGAAPEATLVIAAVAQPKTGEIADPDIVTGAQFVFDRAQSSGLPAVVNLSLGGDFGPHDGSTPLEQALAGLIGPEQKGRAIVVAAGNSAGVYTGDLADQNLGVHTEVRVTAGVPADVPMLSPGKKGDPNLNGGVYIWITYRPGDDIAISLRGPDGLSVPGVKAGSYAQRNENKLYGAIENGVTDDTTGLLATQSGAIALWNGEWEAGSTFVLHLEGEGTAEMWLQGTGDGGPTETSDGVMFEVATWEQTVNVPATHPDLLSVGCTMNRIDWQDQAGEAIGVVGAEYGYPDGACYFSSAGPTATGAAKPEVSAPGGFVIGAMSHDASPAVRLSSIFSAAPGICPTPEQCFVADETHGVLSGSSMSAPQVAGAVALLFERAPNLTQAEVKAIVSGGARYPTGDAPLDYQIGAGVLDVVGMMQAYDLHAGAVPDAAIDAGASWMSLSASHLRPDPSWPLTGTVQLRTAAGTLAGVDDARRLEFVTSGPAVVITPLTRIEAGLYTFVIAAEDRSGTRDITVDVTIDGKPLGQPLTRFSGHRVIPVGPDRWMAHGALSADGGCSMGRPSHGSNPSSSARKWMLLGVASVVALGRRRRGRSPC